MKNALNDRYENALVDIEITIHSQKYKNLFTSNLCQSILLRSIIYEKNVLQKVLIVRQHLVRLLAGHG